MKRTKSIAVERGPQGSIGKLHQAKHTATSNKDFQKLFDVVNQHEHKIVGLWGGHSDALAEFTSIKFKIGESVSAIMAAVRNAKFPGGFKAYHELRDIPVPRQTCIRYAALYQDVACLHLNASVLEAASDAGIDLIKHINKIKTAKAEVQEMNGPQFVAFLQQKPTRIQRPKPQGVADFVEEAMVELSRIFHNITEDEERNQAYAGVAYKIGALATEAAFTGGEFTVKSPLAKDEMEELFHQREV